MIIISSDHPHLGGPRVPAPLLPLLWPQLPVPLPLQAAALTPLLPRALLRMRPAPPLPHLLLLPPPVVTPSLVSEVKKL